LNHLDPEIILLVEVPDLIETVVAGSDNNLAAGFQHDKTYRNNVNQETLLSVNPLAMAVWIPEILARARKEV